MHIYIECSENTITSNHILKKITRTSRNCIFLNSALYIPEQKQ